MSRLFYFISTNSSNLYFVSNPKAPVELVIFLIKAVSYPIASVVALCGGLFIMVGSQERGFSLISRAGIGYIVVQMIPLFMRLLVEIAKAI
ncbi:hypothetical protein ABH948_005616 [Bacillus sp. RC218]